LRDLPKTTAQNTANCGAFCAPRYDEMGFAVHPAKLPVASRSARSVSAHAAKRERTLDMIGKVKSLRELFEIELRYAYDCERKLVEKGLPTMIEKAGSPELRRALEEHLAETRTQVTRLERIFAAMGVEPDTKTNEIFDKLSSAAKDSISNIEESPLRDAALIVNGNLVEHYEIATYGSLAEFARSLGLHNAVPLLEQTLQEEKNADAKLTELAVRIMNTQAARQTA
jgi:ferritin-like metal-binding protein YciE